MLHSGTKLQQHCHCHNHCLPGWSSHRIHIRQPEQAICWPDESRHRMSRRGMRRREGRVGVGICKLDVSFGSPSIPARNGEGLYRDAMIVVCVGSGTNRGRRERSVNRGQESVSDDAGTLREARGRRSSCHLRGRIVRCLRRNKNTRWPKRCLAPRRT